MIYAVTGSTGLIGTALCLRLAEEGHTVHALYRQSYPEVFNRHKNILLIRGDVQDQSSLSKAFLGAEGVFHAAAFARPWASNPEIYFRINELGASNVCTAAASAGVRRVVFTATAAIHGAQEGDVLVHEGQWPDAYFTDYEQSKFNAYQSVMDHEKQGLEVVVVSPARVYGPGHPSESNVPMRLAKMYLQKGFGLAPLDGTGIGSYIYIDDVVQGHLLTMTTAPSGEEYLLGGDNHTYNSFFEHVSKISGKKRPVIKVPYPISLGIGKSQLFLAETLGIQPKITTPWVRKYLKNWGVDSRKIKGLGLEITPLEIGLEKAISAL